METDVLKLLLIMLLCLLLVAPAMAGSMPFSPPPVNSAVTDSIRAINFPGPDIVTSLQSAPIGGPDLLAPALSSDNIIGPVPPTAIFTIPEPNGIMVMLGSGLLVLGLRRRKLKGLI
jgi:hypothetical protein